MLNRVILIGRLVADPELRYTNAGGHAVCSFRIAVDRPFKNQQGEREADFISCKAWRQLGEHVSKYITKGRLIAVEGRLETRTYETPNGEKRSAFDVVCDNVRFLDKAPAGSEQRPAATQSAPSQESRKTAQESAPPPDDFDAPPPSGDEDLPF